MLANVMVYNENISLAEITFVIGREKIALMGWKDGQGWKVAVARAWDCEY